MEIYDAIGLGYTAVRRSDPRIAAALRLAIGDARSLVNVGAGAGSYEPSDVATVAVEPSGVMLGQRSTSAAPAVRARAESLPFPDMSFDVGLAVLTVHHWADADAGLSELRRVSRRQVVLTWDPRIIAERVWFARDYLPESLAREADLVTVDGIADRLGSSSRVTEVAIPADCVDGFYAAYWARPHAYLDPAVRAGISAIALTDEDVVAMAVARLESDLRSGEWMARYSPLLEVDEMDVGYRIVTAGDHSSSAMPTPTSHTDHTM